VVDRQLIKDMRLVMKVVSLGRAARSKAGIKVRQPLDRVFIKVGSEEERDALNWLRIHILEELNVKKIEFFQDQVDLGKKGYALDADGNLAVAVTTEITPQLADEGMARELVHHLQTMRKHAGFDIPDYILTYYQGGTSMGRVIRAFAPYIKQETLSSNLIEGIPDDVYTESHRIDGEEVMLGVLREKGG